jgi:hypothetical protein
MSRIISWCQKDLDDGTSDRDRIKKYWEYDVLKVKESLRKRGSVLLVLTCRTRVDSGLSVPHGLLNVINGVLDQGHFFSILI